MKNSVLSVLSTLTIFAFTAFATVSCSNSDSKEDNKDAESSSINAPDTTKIEHEGFAPTTNIRYVDIDSIAAAYEYAKQEMEKFNQKSLELQQYHNALAAQIQKKQNDIDQKKNNNGYFSNESYQADLLELQNLAQNAEINLTKRAQTLDTELNEFRNTLLIAIENYIIKYNKDKKYDAILNKASGIYFNPEMDLTDEIIKGMNAELKNQTTEVAPATDAAKK